MQIPFYARALLLVGLASQSSAQELNRLDLHNGGDVLWLLNSPFAGAPVSNFDPSADLYWKAYPADVIRRTSGVAPLMGIELHNFDTDPVSTQALWAYSISTGVKGSDGTILPTFESGIFVPGLSTTSTIFPVDCAGPGYLNGWTYDETFIDAATGAPTSLIDLTADGTTDWVFTHFFPSPGFADHDLSSTGPINACGTTGDATLQWFGSTDFFAAGNGGENQPDWTGFDNSIYSGYALGGSGAFTPISDDRDDTPDMAFYFDEPTLNTFVDTDNGDGFGLDPGLGGLRFPLSPSPAFTGQSIGLRIYDDEAVDTGKYGFAYANLRGSLLTQGLSGVPFLGGVLGLDPKDALFLPLHFALGRGPLVVEDDEALFTSNQVPLLFGGPAALALAGQTLELQGFTLEPGQAAQGTNVVTMHFYTL